MDIKQALDDLDISPAKMQWWSQQTMLDGNPSEHHDHFAGNKAKYQAGWYVIVTRYHAHPDIMAVVMSDDGSTLKLYDVDLGTEFHHRKDGVRVVAKADDLSDISDEALSWIKTHEESIAHYGPKRTERGAMIDVCIMMTKMQL